MFSRFTHVVACVRIPFLFLGEEYSIVHLHHILFIRWWTLGSFPPFGYCKWCCCDHRCTNICSSPCFNALDIQLPGNGIAGLMVILCLIFWGTIKLFSMVASIHFSYYFSIHSPITQLVSGCHPRADVVQARFWGTLAVWQHIDADNSMKNTNSWRGLPPCLSQYISPSSSSYQLLWFSTNLMTLPQHPSLPAQFKNLSAYLQAKRSPFQTLLIPTFRPSLKWRHLPCSSWNFLPLSNSDLPIMDFQLPSHPHQSS